MSETRIPKIAKYELTQRAGATPRGPLFRGRHTQLNMDVAVQVLAPDLVRKSPESGTQFLSDARAAGRVEHQALSRVIDCGLDNQLYFIATQWPAGEPLPRVIEREGSLDADRAIALIRDLAGALNAAWREGLLHRELRPDCIVTGTEGRPAQLTEIGMTPLSDALQEIAVAAGATRLTAHFRAPELCIDPTRASCQSDMYSLGAILFTLLAGVRPFEGTSNFDLMRKIVDQPPLDLKQEKPALSAPVVALVNRLLIKDPAGGFKTYDALIEACEACRSGAPASAALELLGPPQPLSSSAAQPDDRSDGAGSGGEASELADSGSAPAPGASATKRKTTKTSPTVGRRTTGKKPGIGTTTRRTGSISGTGRTPAVRTGTGRQEPAAATPTKRNVVMIVASVIALAVIGAVATVVLMSHGGKSPTGQTGTNPTAQNNKIGGGSANPDANGGTGGGTPKSTGGGDEPATEMTPQEKELQAQMDQFASQVNLAQTGDPALEKKLADFLAKHQDRPEAAKLREWIERLKTARMEDEFTRACAQAGQAQVDALTKFLADWPDSRHKAAAEKLRDQGAKDVQSAQWQATFSDLVKNLGVVPAEQIDKHRAMVQAYLAVAATEAGNPFVTQAKDQLTQIDQDAAARLKEALTSADHDMTFGDFRRAIDRLTQYEERFQDSQARPQADAKMRDIVAKADAFWRQTKLNALAKLKSDVSSESARELVADQASKLTGVGTLAGEAKEFSENLKVFDQLQKLAATNDVIPNVANRKMPEVLYVQGKNDLGIIEIDASRIKMTEGGTPVTYMKNWSDLSLPDRLTVYAYLLQPDGEAMPANIQALLDKAKQTLQP
ncbi:MAG: serine/threonine protein kinase [Planctomycetota bacterium]